MTVIVGGGRFLADREMVYSALDALHAETPIILLVHGGCRGADLLADAWAAERGIERVAYPISDAEWKERGKAAGPMRNGHMLRDHPNAFVVAFPGGRGTQNLVKQAHDMNMHTIEVSGVHS